MDLNNSIKRKGQTHLLFTSLLEALETWFIILSQPVEPPPSPVGRGAGAALWRGVVVPVHGGEGVTVVRGEGVGGVAGVAAHPEAKVVRFVLNSKL